MKVIKKINNNVAICLDSAGKEAVVFAKGIGFQKPPYEVDIKDVERTFYDVDPRYFGMIEKADEDIIDIAMDIKSYVDLKNITTSSNLLYSLIDHITYSIERSQKGIYFNLPIANDIQHMFPDEMEIGRYALTLIEKRLKIKLPKEEASYIALNIINSEKEIAAKLQKEDQAINEVAKIISEEMNVKINKDSVNYSRFVSHMHYLLKKTSYTNPTLYKDLFESVKEKEPRFYACALKAKEYLDSNGHGPLSEDEVLFLTLHIDRLCTREEN